MKRRILKQLRARLAPAQHHNIHAPTTCGGCGMVIRLSEGGYSIGREGYRCDACTAKTFVEKDRKRKG